MYLGRVSCARQAGMESTLGETFTVRHPGRDHSFEVEGEEGLPPSATPTEEPAVYEIADERDCLICHPPAETPYY